jgi:hypothetical protein
MGVTALLRWIIPVVLAALVLGCASFADVTIQQRAASNIFPDQRPAAGKVVFVFDPKLSCLGIV